MLWFLGWIVWLFWMVVLFVLWIIGALLFGLWWNQGKLLYMTEMADRQGERRGLDYNPPGTRHPGEYGLPYENHMLKTSDGHSIHCWLITQPEDKLSQCATLIFFHGNAGNIGFRLPNARELYLQLGCNILLVEYKGYGNSSGTPTEKGLLIDAQQCLDFLLKRDDIDSSKIFCFGRSLGGGVAISLAYRNPQKIRGVIVENTFLSIDKMVVQLAQKMTGRKMWKVVDYFLYFYLTNHWKSESKISAMSCPVLFLSGAEDELVPPQHMRLLYEKCNNRSKKFLSVPGGTHNDTYVLDPQTYYDTITTFFADNMH